MLLLTRRPGEKVVIGGEITVVVAGVNGHQVRLGIQAPAGATVDREEIHLRRTASLVPLEPVPASQAEDFDIDEHIRLAADARRYRWLRDVAWDTTRQDLALRDRHQNMLIEDELDAEIDRAMAAYPGESVGVANA
ncbi:carbon storage regulator [Pseudomonas typographi]|uniref:Translational regulator CsrA n=1 Tax=Pseudomonas typographi TaxID=2715964 RepID=A0ABR7YZH7_9PSED|nr:carbon storage regulator [Pseudomonas typographi]MBD1598618.1 carbon storage regulator [Pseudomonas typographi]